ncbi:MAG TPA: chemotaxis protein CheD [Fibrobacteria bacterium]|nr:chemotaxis protein CheD [Fibrobacteria bacterium]
MTERRTIGISERYLSRKADDLLVTHALGSCVGVAIHDPVAMVGGILHYMLPNGSLDATKAQENPFMFGDTGIPAFFKEAYAMGASKERLRVVIAGGARVIESVQSLDIGARNVVIARKLFWKNGVLIAAEDVEGNRPRTLFLEVATGRTWFTSRGEVHEL